MTLNYTLHFKCADQTLPTQSGQYLCIKNGGKTWQSLEWSARYQRFNASDCLPDCKNAIKVDWWAPFPQWTIN